MLNCGFLLPDIVTAQLSYGAVILSFLGTGNQYVSGQIPVADPEGARQSPTCPSPLSLPPLPSKCREVGLLKMCFCTPTIRVHFPG